MGTAVNNQNRSKRFKRIHSVLFWVLWANLGVAAGKGMVGLSVGSIGMVADAFHSLMDGSSNVIGLIGIRLAARPQDDTHAYGHTKFENFASMGVVILLALTAIEIARSVYNRLTAETPQVPDANLLAFAVMGGTMIINIIISTLERGEGRKLNSGFLVADSRHTLSDVWVSLSVIGSLLVTRLGYPIMDALIGGIIALVIAWSAFQIMKEASTVLLDRAVLDPREVERICLSVEDEGIIGCHKIRTRGSGAGYWIDLHLLVEPDMTTKESHHIASQVERKLKQSFGEDTDTMIHIEPGR